MVASFLIAPAVLYDSIWPGRWRGGRVDRTVRIIWLWLASASLLFGAVAEFTLWVEFSPRFNFIAIDYLIYTNEVIGNIRESYPVPIILAAIALAAAVVTWPLRHAAMARGKLSVGAKGQSNIRTMLLADSFATRARSRGLTTRCSSSLPTIVQRSQARPSCP